MYVYLHSNLQHYVIMNQGFHLSISLNKTFRFLFNLLYSMIYVWINVKFESLLLFACYHLLLLALGANRYVIVNVELCH